jgi:hypothetical protein
MEYPADMLTVQDILYSRVDGSWRRDAGRYTRIRIAPETLTRILMGAGFRIDVSAVNKGIITVIARREA